MRMRVAFCLALAVSWLAGAAHAVSFTLDSIPSGPLTTGNGQLQISNISFVSLAGGVAPGDITFEVTNDGVKLSGPVSVSGTGLKSFGVLYDLTAIGQPFDNASLLLESRVDADIVGLVLSTKQILSDDILDDPTKDNNKGWPFDNPIDLDPLDLQTLAFLRTADWEIFDDNPFKGPLGLGRDGAVKLVEQGFDPQSHVRVIDAILVQAVDGNATWTSSTNGFAVVPEPGTAALTALGLLVLARGSRQRTR